jgi:hypothetical protein
MDNRQFIVLGSRVDVMGQWVPLYHGSLMWLYCGAVRNLGSRHLIGMQVLIFWGQWVSQNLPKMN